MQASSKCRRPLLGSAKEVLLLLLLLLLEFFRIVSSVCKIQRGTHSNESVMSPLIRSMITAKKACGTDGGMNSAARIKARHRTDSSLKDTCRPSSLPNAAAAESGGLGLVTWEENCRESLCSSFSSGEDRLPVVAVMVEWRCSSVDSRRSSVVLSRCSKMGGLDWRSPFRKSRL